MNHRRSEASMAKRRRRIGQRKLGRNDLCPCGSGRKYKHCHWGLEIPLRARL